MENSVEINVFTPSTLTFTASACLSETGSHAAQVDLDLILLLPLPSTGVTSLCHQPWLQSDSDYGLKPLRLIYAESLNGEWTQV